MACYRACGCREWLIALMTKFIDYSVVVCLTVPTLQIAIELGGN